MCANSLAWWVGGSVGRSLGRKLLFVFPLTNAQLHLTKRKMSLNGSANVKHTCSEEWSNEWWDSYCYVNSMWCEHFLICCPSYEMNTGSWQAWVLITWCVQYMNIKQNNKLLQMESTCTVLASRGKEKERKNTSEGKKKRKKKFVCLQPLRLELSPFTLSQLSNTVYQCIEL